MKLCDSSDSFGLNIAVEGFLSYLLSVDIKHIRIDRFQGCGNDHTWQINSGISKIVLNVTINGSVTERDFGGFCATNWLLFDLVLLHFSHF